MGRREPPIARRPGDPGPFLLLAPMDGVTDHVYRALITELYPDGGGVSLCASEFVRVSRQRVVDHVLFRHCPELRNGGRTPAGVPVMLQLLGGEPGPMADTARRAAELGASGIDLNFGCPSKTVNGSDGGASLLRAPCRVEDVTRAVREAVPAHLPVSVKVRVGWDSAMPILDIARAAEQGGGSWLTIHGRTRKQLYKPPVDWAAIGRAREHVSIPVVANGDLFTVEAIEACRRVSGCEHFMVGRGAMARPDLFVQARGGHTEDLAMQQLLRIVDDYIERMEADGRSERHALGRAKMWLRMAALIRDDMREPFDELKRTQSLEGFRAGLRDRAQTSSASRRSRNLRSGSLVTSSSALP